MKWDPQPAAGTTTSIPTEVGDSALHGLSHLAGVADVGCIPRHVAAKLGRDLTETALVPSDEHDA